MAEIITYVQSKLSVPIPLSGLKLWLKADAGVTLNGSTVSAIDDQSGNNWDLSQPTAVKQPEFIDNYINGKPAIFMKDGGMCCLTNNSFDSYSEIGDFTIYFVGKVMTIADNVLFGFGSSWLNRGIYTYSNTQVYATLSGSALNNNYSGYYNNWLIYTLRYKVSTQTMELLINGNSIGTNIKALSSLGNGVTWGGVTLNYYGYTTEFICYTQYNSDLDKDKIVNYLKAKYGL